MIHPAIREIVVPMIMQHIVYHLDTTHYADGQKTLSEDLWPPQVLIESEIPYPLLRDVGDRLRLHWATFETTIVRTGRTMRIHIEVDLETDCFSDTTFVRYGRSEAKPHMIRAMSAIDTHGLESLLESPFPETNSPPPKRLTKIIPPSEMLKVSIRKRISL